MPAPRTTDELLELVRKSGVVEEKRLAAALDALRAADEWPESPQKFAPLLVRDGVLTHFQAEQVLQGKWRKFTIGKYKVLERLGAGGMGSVYLCEHILMRRRVAVKVLPGNKAQDSSSLERFHREARAVAALDHPNIVRAYDIDQEDNLHFLVMEHVDGANLQEIIERTGPMDPLRAAHYMRQSALGLQHAHEQGLVHRDIKPGNILVDRNGIVKVLDMGLARFFNDEEDMLTKKYDENVLGTADYLAPEQALDSHGVDIRADIYSLGGTFYFCLTGRTPFAEGTVAQKLIWHQTRLPKSVQSLRPEVPNDLAAVVEKMMAKSPEGRYQTPLELAEALAPFTSEPIPPPPEQEMPQLSPAALRAPGSSMTTLPPPVEGVVMTKDDVTPTRKIWSVASPGGAPAKAAAPPSSPAGMPTPVSTPATSPPRPASPTRPAVAKVPRPDSKPATPPVNGTPTTPRPNTPPARQAAHVQPVDQVTNDAPLTPADLPFDGVIPRRLDRRLNLHSRSTGFWVLVGLAALAAVAGVAALVYVLTATPKRKGTREPLRLTSSDPNALVALLRERVRPGDRVILNTDSLRGSGIYLQNLPPNLTIEPEEGKTVVWSYAPNVEQRSFLVLLQGPELTLRGITFDGEGKVATGVQLYSDCPGLRLEQVSFRGFTAQGLAITSCQGSETRPVVLNDLSFETTAASQAAIRFLLIGGARHVPANRFITVGKMKVTGPGKWVTAADGKVIGADVNFPEGVKPVP